MSMLLSIAYSNICGRKCGKPERISAHRQQHVREPVQRLDGAPHVAHCCSRKHPKHVESRCLRRWKVSRESSPAGIGVVIDGSGGRHGQNKQIDRTSRQQCCRICCSSRSAAIGFRPWRHNAPCVFRFRSSGQADEGGIRVPELAALFSTLDLAKIGPLT